MPNITLRFVGGKGMISNGIRAAEYGFWATHVEALTTNNTLLGAHIEGGVRERPINYDKDQFIRELYIEIPNTEDIYNRFHVFLRNQLGKPYDVEAIIAFVTSRNWQEPDSWFCSELQAAALVNCGWFASPLATEFNHITPRDLLLIISGRIRI